MFSWITVVAALRRYFTDTHNPADMYDCFTTCNSISCERTCKLSTRGRTRDISNQILMK